MLGINFIRQRQQYRLIWNIRKKGLGCEDLLLSYVKKAESKLGYKPQVNFDDGLKEVLAGLLRIWNI